MNRSEFGKPVKREALKRSGGRCEAVGCNKPVFRRNLCSMHLSRLVRHGSIEAMPRKPQNGAPLKWLQSHVGHTDAKCLIPPFAGGRDSKVTFEGTRMMSYKAMCIMAHGAQPSPLHEVAHGCGNGHLGCANPQHLRWATRAENMADKIEHGTTNRGERHGQARFTSETIKEIRAALEAGESQRAIATRHGTSQGTISKVARGERWGWLK